ncbi:hypothetical protein [Dactylosporangium sp. NPDC000521]|uniref:hypothetical protein n=1 Tax=Dactylosporangium sp. NPDC000521 TaxID=3363975 RepID=UPI003696193B
MPQSGRGDGLQEGPPELRTERVAGEYDAATAATVDGLRTSGKPVTEAVAQILPFLDAPPAGLTAVLEGRRIAFAADPGSAARLDDITRKLLESR